MTCRRKIETALLLDRLHQAKVRDGTDWLIHSSWASDQPLVIAIVRRRGARLGHPICGRDMYETLERATRMAEAGK